MSKKRRRAANGRRQRGAKRSLGRAYPAESPDRRSIFAETLGADGAPGDPIVVIEPIRVGTDILYFQAPFVAPFYLLKSKELRDAAEPKRVAALRRTVATPDGSLRPGNPAAAFDALENLALAAILAMGAIETYANGAIGRLPDDAMVEIPRRVQSQTIIVMRNKAAMEWLSMSEKITRAVPLLTGRSSIKGTKAWEAFRRLKRIRDGLVHVKREAYNDPDRPSPFGRLMLGEGSRAPEDAALVIEALEPGWLPAHVRGPLGVPAASS